MAKEELECREVKFESMDDLVGEAKSLLESGYEAVGNWNLAQVCGHSGNWMRYPIEGFPKPGCLVGVILSLMKATIGKGQLKKVLESGSMPKGRPTMPESVPKPSELSDLEAVEHLEKTVDRFINHKGEWHPSPLFGDMDRETLTKLNLIHSAHHFGFLIPKSGD